MNPIRNKGYEVGWVWRTMMMMMMRRDDAEAGWCWSRMMLKQDDAEAGWCWSRMMMQQDPIRGQETLILYLPAASKVCDHPLPISDIDEQSSKPVTSGDRSAGWPTAPAKVQRRTEAIAAPKVRIRPSPISDIDEPSGNRHVRREIIRITTSSSARRKRPESIACSILYHSLTSR